MRRLAFTLALLAALPAVAATRPSGMSLDVSSGFSGTATGSLTVPQGSCFVTTGWGQVCMIADGTIRFGDSAGAGAALIFNVGQLLFRNYANNAYLGAQFTDIQANSGTTIKWDIIPASGFMRIASDIEQRWSSTTVVSGSADVGLKRSAAGVVCATNGAGTCTGRIQTGAAGSASLDFGATAAGTCDLLTITVTGAADGDPVSCGVPTALAASDAYQSFAYYVSATNTVTVKRCNLTNAVTALSNPATATVRCTVAQ